MLYVLVLYDLYNGDL